jgi:hypothetical protein
MTRATIIPLHQEIQPRLINLLETSPWIATEVEGMRYSLEDVTSVNKYWIDNPLSLSSSDFVVPSRDEIRQSLWISDNAMKEVRAFTSYECFDIRVVMPRSDDGADLLVVQRTDPTVEGFPLSLGQAATPTIESAPLNHFLAPVGGRISYAAPGSPLEGRWSEMQAALLKLRQESGIEGEDIASIYSIGYTRMSFPGTDGKRLLRYRGLSRGEDSTKQKVRTRDVRLINGQNSAIRNIVIICKPSAVGKVTEKLSTNQYVKLLGWISNVEFKKVEFRRYFCAYELALMDSVYRGWEEAQRRDVTEQLTRLHPSEIANS